MSPKRDPSPDPLMKPIPPPRFIIPGGDSSAARSAEQHWSRLVKAIEQFDFASGRKLINRMDLCMQCDILVLDDLRKEEPFNLLISK